MITSLETGGAQFVLQRLIQFWQDPADSHRVICLGGEAPLAGRLRTMGVAVECLNLPSNIGALGSLPRIAGAIRAAKPDLVQTWLYHADLLGSLAAHRAGVKSVVWGVHHTLSGADSLRSSTWPILYSLVLLARFLPVRIITCAESALRSHASFGYPMGKMLCIPNGIDTSEFKPDAKAAASLRDELGLPGSCVLIGMFARFHPQKDHLTLLRAMRIAMGRHPELHMVLSGAGITQDNPHFQEVMVAAGVSSRVHLLGPRNDMPRLHAAVDLVTLSAAFGEAMPLTLAEGMACATPCVSTDVGDAAHLLAGTGRLVPARNPEALAEAWLETLELPRQKRLELGRQARSRVVAAYDVRGMAAAYRKLYRSLA